MTDASAPSILLVDDDPQVLDMFERILEPDYTLYVAESGDAALDVIDDHIDGCLVDRRMPGLTGEELVERFREEGFDLPVAMVTAVEPDFDVIEMGFDDYIVKPVSADELRSLVESLLLRRQYDEILREYFALASKITTLRASKSPDELASNENYTHVVDDLNEIKLEAKQSLEAAIDDGVIEELVWQSFLDGQEMGR